MRLINSFTRLLCLASTLILLAGCGDGTYKLSPGDLAAFKDAAPQIKQTWERGLAASKANDYFNAQTNLTALLSEQISPAQLLAVQTALGDLNPRIHEAAAKGNAAAQKAVEAMKANAPVHGR